jgi:hypothetical protein
MDKPQTQQFIENSRHALNHLFDAIGEYNNVLVASQKDVEEIENAQEALSDLFMYRDQWSVNANYHYAQYMERIGHLNTKKQEAAKDLDVRLNNALSSIGATVDSISSLAGSVLQISKQVLSLRHGGKPTIPTSRTIGSQSIIEIIWEGRNHAMHWDEGAPRARVQTMLNALYADLGLNIVVGNNNCLSILGALDWDSADAVVRDLNALI